MCSKSSKDFGPGEVWIRAPPPPALRRACLPRALDATRFSRPGPILGGRNLIREPHAMTPPQIRYRSRIHRRIGHFGGSAGASPVNLLADWIVRSQAVDQNLSGRVVERDWASFEQFPTQLRARNPDDFRGYAAKTAQIENAGGAADPDPLPATGSSHSEPQSFGARGGPPDGSLHRNCRWPRDGAHET